MTNERLKGLTAAVITPMDRNGRINLKAIDRYAEFLIERKVAGVFVCGTTGEGALLDNDERKAVAEKWMDYSDRLNILVHVGSTSYRISQDLARHAGEIGARAISAMGPCFLQPSRAEELVAFNKEIASAAPDTPYYYYNIPGATGVNVRMSSFLEMAGHEIPNLMGIKFTSYDTWDMMECIKMDCGRFDILHGHDETLVTGLQLGATGGIGTSYNVTSPIFNRMLEAFRNGDYVKAVEIQNEANKIVSLMCKYVNCIPGIKAMLETMGIESGPCRLPIRNLDGQQREALEKEFLQMEDIIK